jgi:NADPH-dependent ferric siderophore reductase
MKFHQFILKLLGYKAIRPSFVTKWGQKMKQAVSYTIQQATSSPVPRVSPTLQRILLHPCLAVTNESHHKKQSTTKLKFPSVPPRSNTAPPSNTAHAWNRSWAILIRGDKGATHRDSRGYHVRRLAEALQQISKPVPSRFHSVVSKPSTVYASEQI